MNRGGQGEVQGQRLQVTGAEPTYRPCEEWVGKLGCNRPAWTGGVGMQRKVKGFRSQALSPPRGRVRVGKRRQAGILQASNGLGESGCDAKPKASAHRR